MMEDRNQEITEYLQREDVQARIHQRIHRGRSEASVTISNAAHLFGFTENQLRDWDEKGLLKPQRPPLEFTQDGKNTKRRQYAPAELDKLAVIRELMDKGFSPGTIPPNIDELWKEITGSKEQHYRPLMVDKNETKHLHIDQRIELAEEEVFWRYFVSQALRLSIMLICEDIPDTLAGLVLPLQKKNVSDIVHNPSDLPKLGNSLIGWLGRNRSFYTFLDTTPSFEFPSDFRVQPLVVAKEGMPEDNTLIVVQRKATSLNLGDHVIETIRRLLEPIYKNVEKWWPCFDYGMRDWVYQVADFTSSPNPPDDVLNGLTNMIVLLGGKTTDGQDCWRFCCILLPKNSMLPLQQRSLVVRAQSKYAPHKVGETTISPQRDKPLIGLSLRAFQSGRIAYRSETFAEDSTIAFSEAEGSIRSAIAIPIGGENGTAVAVLYIVSDGPDAFSQGDQRVLRMMGKMIEELLMTYHARQQVTHKLTEMIKKPSVVDTLFEDFLSENEFTRDVTAILTDIQTRMKEREKRSDEKGELHPDFDTDARIEHLSEEVVSFIAVDIDNQSRLANRYGDRMTRNLSREIGLRIERELSRLFTEHADCRFYHIYADRFYLLLKSISLEQARDKAVRLRQILNGFYQIDTLRSSIEETLLADSMQTLSISVRLGITSYHFTKLEDLLQRYSAASAITKVRNIIFNSLDKSLEAGRIEGGDVIMTWDPFSEGSEFIRLTPPKSS